VRASTTHSLLLSFGMSNPPVTTSTYEGWTIVFDFASNNFVATKGRKRRTASHLSWLHNEIDKAEGAERRAALRIHPCEFTVWDDEKATEHRVQMTSYSDKGLGIRPVAGGEIISLPLGGYGGSWGSDESGEKDTIKLVKDGVSTQRLHRAVEGVRRANEELRLARKECITFVKVKRTTGNRIDEYTEEEMRLRGEINRVNGREVQS
jgi:hypothetical protein